MLDKAKPILGVSLFLIVAILILTLFVNVVNWFIFLVSPRVMDLGCGAIVLLIIWISAICKTTVEIKANRHIYIFRWLGPLLATLLFIGFVRLINGLDTMEQFGCGFGLFFIVLFLFSSLQSQPSIEGDDEDDYHASR